MCVISSHGSEDVVNKKEGTLTPVVYAADNLPMRINDIAKDVCTTLDPQKFKGKPKLFFIQVKYAILYFLFYIPERKFKGSILESACVGQG